MRSKALKIILHTNCRRSSGVEPGLSTIVQWNGVVEAYELHEHVADDYNEVLDITSLILLRHFLDCRFSLP